MDMTRAKDSPRANRFDEKYRAHDPEQRRAYRVRCHVHKWRNISDVLTLKQSAEAVGLFWAVREARDMTQAMECAAALEKLRGKFNASALTSFLEAKDDLLALHRLGLSAELRRFFSTTNPIESLNSLLEEDMRRVKRWQDSAHFQREYNRCVLMKKSLTDTLKVRHEMRATQSRVSTE